MKKLKFVIIGCGRIFYKYVEVLVKNIEEVELVVICDVILEKVEVKKIEYIEKIGVV